MKVKALLQVTLFLLLIQPALGRSQANLPRAVLSPVDAHKGSKQDRRIIFNLESFGLTTNLATARLITGEEIPSRIAVIVKPITASDADAVDPFVGFRRPSAAGPDGFKDKMDANLVAMKDFRAAWQDASWIPFTTNLTIDLGPGSGWRVVWVAAKWNGEMEQATGTYVQVDRTSEFTILTQSGSTDGSQDPNDSSKIVAVQGSLKTNAVTLNANQPACGTFRLHLTETTGRNLILLASTNLIDWMPILTNLNSKQTFDYVDTNVAQYPCRFFRVIAAP